MQTRAGGGWRPWAYVKEVLEHSCKVFFFFFFVSVGSYKRTCQGCKCLEGYISSSYAVVCSEMIHSILEYLGATLVMQSHHSILLHKNALWPLTHHQSPRTRLNLWETQLLQNFCTPCGLYLQVFARIVWLPPGHGYGYEFRGNVVEGFALLEADARMLWVLLSNLGDMGGSSASSLVLESVCMC